MTTTERPAEPGEVCDCGRPAVVVFITEAHGPVPWCGQYLHHLPPDAPEEPPTAT